MKKDIHPEYKELTLILGEDKFFTNSTSSAGEMLMDVDFRKHPAWNKNVGNIVNKANKNISNFNKKFGSLSL